MDKVRFTKLIALFVFAFTLTFVRSQTSIILVSEKIPFPSGTATCAIIVIDTVGNQQSITAPNFFTLTNQHEDSLNKQFNKYSNLGYKICSSTVYSYGAYTSNFHIWTRYILCKGGLASGIKENNLKKQSLILYPNPSHSEITIMTSDQQLIGNNYSISDLNGKIIQTGVLTTDFINISLEKYSNGTYIFKVDGINNCEQKFIKN